MTNPISMPRHLVFALAASAFATVAIAAEPGDTIRKAIEKIAPSLAVESVTASPINGVSEVVFGSKVVYITDDAKYMLQGKLVDLSTREDLTERTERGLRARELAAVKPTDAITFSPENPKHTITVFTDIDCGYCRKLHAEIKDYLAEGIAVRYLAFPRAGIDSESYNKAVSVWCADDRKAAMTNAKAGSEPAALKCDNPVAAQYDLGVKIGVTGTPAIVTTDGTMLPGYIPAKRLRGYLQQIGG